MEYIVKNKKTGKFFSGFDESNNPIFGSTEQARRYDNKLVAEGQASCMYRFDSDIQKKPVAL